MRYLIVFVIVAVTLATTLLAETRSFGGVAAIAAQNGQIKPTPKAQSFEAVAVIAAGSINPPNPVNGCNRAKENATKKAASAGFRGAVKWDRLSNDSDCSLHTEGAAGKGYFYIFTAKGTFSK